MGDIHAYNCKVYDKNNTANECTCGVIKMSVLEDEYVGTRWVKNGGTEEQVIYRVIKMPDGMLAFMTEGKWEVERFGLNADQVHMHILAHPLRRY